MTMTVVYYFEGKVCKTLCNKTFTLFILCLYRDLDIFHDLHDLTLSFRKDVHSADNYPI